MEGSGQAKVGIGVGLKKLLDLMFIDVDGEAKLKADILKSNSKLARSNITNTILTDFLELTKESDELQEIVKFENYKLRVVMNSIAYYQRISPYLLMADGKLKIDDEFDLNMNKIHDTLRSGKGYYELIATSKSKEVILRFNNTAFKNNYSVSDLDQMNLVLYAIKVGKMDSSLLDFNNLMENLTNIDNSSSLNNSDDIVNFYQKEKFLETENTEFEGNPSSNLLEVYDVVLAGVE